MFIQNNSSVPVSDQQTPETYMGSKRASNYMGETRLFAGQQEPFVLADNLGKDQWSIGGNWDISSEKITARNNAILRFNVSAKDVYVVASADATQSIGVRIGGKPISETNLAGADVKNSMVNVQGARLYKLLYNSQNLHKTRYSS